MANRIDQFTQYLQQTTVPRTARITRNPLAQVANTARTASAVAAVAETTTTAQTVSSVVVAALEARDTVTISRDSLEQLQAEIIEQAVQPLALRLAELEARVELLENPGE